jgi:starch synthase (maltosyl-transferring)
VEAGQDVAVDLQIGAELVRDAAKRAPADDAAELKERARAVTGKDQRAATKAALDAQLAELVAAYPDDRGSTTYDRELEIVVDRERARFSAWYELFPRSLGDGRHGTLRDVIEHLPYVAGLGFDVLYLPPIHPIGREHRKGRNNTEHAVAGDVGSPWGIGAAEGGHTAIHPDLGTLDDLGALLAAAAEHGLEIALDLAYNCAPDHPWVREHPEFFRKRPDGSIQYAENPPKRYQDIYPLDFESAAWQELWDALRDVVRFWVDRGVRMFRVDNPHTKAFPFWEWLIRTVKEDTPDVLFLSEAFTRPRVMEHLAKIGFTQSYTYFTWRTSAWELRQYLEELTQTDRVEYFRPNFWPNTPDILPYHLHGGHRPTFAVRLILAATLTANYGIYGPAFELLEGRALAPEREEYLDSEKFELRSWELDREDSLAELITRVNAIRREHPALQLDRTLRFHETGNDALLAYSKQLGDDLVVIVANLDPWQAQSGMLQLPLHDLGVDGDGAYRVHDLIGGARYTWHGPSNYVELDPSILPAHVLHVEPQP